MSQIPQIHISTPDYAWTRQHFALTQTVAPTIEPVTIQEAQAHLRQEDQQEVGYITALITAARMHAEAYTQRSLNTQTWRFKLDSWPTGYCLSLPRPNLISVTGITYVDTDGTTQTLAADQYLVDAASEPGRVEPAYGVCWPDVRSQAGAVTITYTAGYGATRALVPQPIKQAILILIGQWYENREATISGTIVAKMPDAWEALLSPFRIEWEQ